MMDSAATTKDSFTEDRSAHGNILLDIIKEVCSDTNSKLSKNLIGKVNRIIADCNLTHYSSFHKLHTLDENDSTVLGFFQETATDLTFDEQAELNQAIVYKIQTKLSIFNSELESLSLNIGSSRKSRKEQIAELQESLNDKLNILKDLEHEKAELMMQWYNHRLNDVITFSTNLNELWTSKTKILELKTKILHFQILWNIFTETNRSIKAYSEIHKDMKEDLHEIEERIKNYKAIISSDFN